MSAPARRRAIAWLSAFAAAVASALFWSAVLTMAFGLAAGDRHPDAPAPAETGSGWTTAAIFAAAVLLHAVGAKAWRRLDRRLAGERGALERDARP